MTGEILFKTLKHLVEQGDVVLTEIRDMLIEYRNSGGQQQQAQIIGERLRTNFSKDEQLDDRVLEILDVVTGWCRTELKIWNQVAPIDL